MCDVVKLIIHVYNGTKPSTYVYDVAKPSMSVCDGADSCISGSDVDLAFLDAWCPAQLFYSV